ncbi:MAG: FAD-binding oxidoreductase [Pelagimonas sp.]|nr:FAD-binding oxidoreductase [Pelagimonas sp.]
MTIDQSLWCHSAQETPTLPPQALPDHVDVAIVGGGYTGLSCALFCAEAGIKTQVFEGETVGFGGSGRNVGLVNAGLWLPPDQVEAALGPRGPAFLNEFGEAPAQVFDLIEKYQIQCEATRAGTLHAAHAPAGLRDLQTRHVAWQRRGAPVDLLDAGQMGEMTGSRAFHGGLWDHRAGTVNPMGYARGLARAARAAGAAIATQCPVQGLRRVGDAWQVETAKGVVQARYVVMATNAYSTQAWPGLQKSWTDIHFFQLATAPMGARAAHILPGGQGLWDTGLIMRSLRRDQEGRVIVGSMGRMVGTAQSGLSARWARRMLRRLYPELGEVRFEHGWHGTIAMTPDHLPQMIELDHNVYAPISYNGRGVTTGTLFGRSLAQLVQGAEPDALPLPLTRAKGVNLKGLTERFYDLAFTANQLR